MNTHLHLTSRANKVALKTTIIIKYAVRIELREGLQFIR